MSGMKLQPYQYWLVTMAITQGRTPRKDRKRCERVRPQMWDPPSHQKRVCKGFFMKLMGVKSSRQDDTNAPHDSYRADDAGGLHAQVKPRPLAPES